MEVKVAYRWYRVGVDTGVRHAKGDDDNQRIEKVDSVRQLVDVDEEFGRKHTRYNVWKKSA